MQDFATWVARGIPDGISRDELADLTRKAAAALFGSRYAKSACPLMRIDSLKSPDESVPFAGFTHPDNPASGVYGGMSLVWFPVPTDDDHPASSLLTLVCGTRGLAPDEAILGRPGHARHLQALRRHLAESCGVRLWAKPDPANLDQPFPSTTARQWPQFARALERYGTHIYAAVPVPADSATAATVVAALTDFYAEERGWPVLKAARAEVDALWSALRRCLFPRVALDTLHSLLLERRFVILQGPPGTGKSRLADALRETAFHGHGMSVQFHPAVSYETFVAGIAPDVHEQLLRFAVRPGWLVQAIRAAQRRPEPYLLHIDEINRADLGRILGEAIYLFEPREITEGRPRVVQLPQPLPDGADTLSVPPNLYVLGTMNSADRSIAILDLAVRRRFAFVDLWPDTEPVCAQPWPLARTAFEQLIHIFSQYAPDDAMPLLPGHAYFLAQSHSELNHRLGYELMPLLREYLQEGRLGPCETELRAYLDWLESELANHAPQD